MNIIFENEEFVAINKPSGLLTIPDREQSERSLKEMLVANYGNIFTIHRLDKETSGIVLFAKNEVSHKFFSKLFEDRLIEKYYLGVAVGNLAAATGSIEAPLAEHPLHKGTMHVYKNGKPSLTTYEVVEAHKSYSLVSFQLHTGRTHQIRVHAKHIGHPLACDPLYGDGKPVLLSSIKKKYKLGNHDREERPMIGRLALHSYKLKFKDTTGIEREFIADMPKEFRALMQQLGKLDYQQ